MAGHHGPKAIYRGSGTINENGLYGFQIVAVDGDISAETIPSG
jgi:hypothetical protein